MTHMTTFSASCPLFSVTHSLTHDHTISQNKHKQTHARVNSIMTTNQYLVRFKQRTPLFILTAHTILTPISHSSCMPPGVYEIVILPS